MIQQAPIPVAQTPLALWLAFATPVTVAAIGVVQIYFVTRQGKKIDDIHTFTNSALGLAFRGEALARRLLAINTGKQEDIEAADRAEAVSRNHDATQAIIDVRKGA